MIHQLIFANPKPGMSVKEFQDYWINVHAIEYASKIEQIKKYKVNRILPIEDGKDPVFHGMAEIWLENEEEQLASLLSDEYVHGARADEPNWAAFWETVGLDTYSYDKVLCDEEPEYKILLLMKRREGVPLKIFREYIMDNIGKKLEKIENLKQLTISMVKDNLYSVGETSFDGAIHIWFGTPESIKETMEQEEWKSIMSDIRIIINEKYLYQFLCQENRIF
ncbi:MAG: EthD domain-containing protein [Lachnospiraceae bacterium]|nr:EthD domain-containing protein [Lachnospiraceae bacterium]